MRLETAEDLGTEALEVDCIPLLIGDGPEMTEDFGGSKLPLTVFAPISRADWSFSPPSFQATVD